MAQPPRPPLLPVPFAGQWPGAPRPPFQPGGIFNLWDVPPPPGGFVGHNPGLPQNPFGPGGFGWAGPAGHGMAAPLPPAERIRPGEPGRGAPSPYLPQPGRGAAVGPPFNPQWMGGPQNHPIGLAIGPRPQPQPPLYIGQPGQGAAAALPVFVPPDGGLARGPP